MKWTTSIGLAASVVLATVVIPAGAASAKYIPDPSPPAGPYSLAVDNVADTNNAGTSLRWRAKITCPQGEPFDISGEIRQDPAPLPAPYTGWESYYISATAEAEGTCRGRSQTVRLDFTVNKTTVFSPTGTPKQVFLPIEPAPAALVAQLYFDTPTTPERGNPYYCSFIGGDTGEDGTVCEDATQVGPLLRLS